MSKHAELVEELRDKAFKMCGPTMEAVHTKTLPWKAADAIEAMEKLNNTLEKRIEECDDARDWLIERNRTLDARIADLEAALELADKMALSVYGSWGAFEWALRSEIGNTNYHCVNEKLTQYRAARATLGDSDDN